MSQNKLCVVRYTIQSSPFSGVLGGSAINNKLNLHSRILFYFQPKQTHTHIHHVVQASQCYCWLDQLASCAGTCYYRLDCVRGWRYSSSCQVISSKTLSKSKPLGSIGPVNVKAHEDLAAQSVFALRRSRQLSRTAWGTSVSLGSHHQLTAFPQLNKSQIRLYSTEGMYATNKLNYLFIY